MKPEHVRRLGYVVQDARMCLRYMRQGHLDQATSRLVQAFAGVAMEAGFSTTDSDPERSRRCGRILPVLHRVRVQLQEQIFRLQWLVADGSPGERPRRAGSC